MVFGGDSLKLNTSTEIRFKSKATGVNTTITFPNLILNGGLLNTGDDVVFTIAGTITVPTNSVIDTLDANNINVPDDQRGYLLAANIAGSGNLTLNMGRTIAPALQISGANNGFSGNWIINAGWFEAVAGSLGTGNITLNSTTRREYVYLVLRNRL